MVINGEDDLTFAQSQPFPSSLSSSSPPPSPSSFVTRTPSRTRKEGKQELMELQGLPFTHVDASTSAGEIPAIAGSSSSSASPPTDPSTTHPPGLISPLLLGDDKHQSHGCVSSSHRT